MFFSAAGDKILKYKEFWKENEECKEKFDEEGSIYKLFDSDYVAGVLNLPDKALSEEEIDAQIEEVDKEKEGEEGEEKEGGGVLCPPVGFRICHVADHSCAEEAIHFSVGGCGETG